MNFKEFRLISEAKKELYAAIGRAPTDALLKTKVDPVVSKMHDDVFGAEKHHIEMPLDNDLPEKVRSHVESNGDKVEGDNVKLKTGRIAPISKYLAKSNAPKDVQDEHQNWTRNKVGNSKLVITRHPAEVASMSTGTHWDSCAKATKKNSKDNVPAWNAMPAELHNGTLMAMHVHRDATPGKDGNYASKDVLGRALIKRHDADIESENPDEVTFHREGRKYGAFPDSAKKAVDEFTAKHYPQKNLTAHKHHMLYDDDGQTVRVNTSHPDTEHAFTPGHDKELSANIQHTIITHPSATENMLGHAAHSTHAPIREHVGEYSTNPDTIRKVFQHKSEATVQDMRAKIGAAKNPHAPKDVVDDAVKHEDYTVREGAFLNPNVSTEHISTGLKDRNSWVQSNAAAHPKLTKEHVNEIIGRGGQRHSDGEPMNLGTTMRSAVKSPHASHDQIMDALHHPNAHVALAALSNPKIDKSHVLHALDSPHQAVNRTAMTMNAVDHDVLRKAVLHDSEHVRAAALSHAKMTPELFAVAKTHPDPAVSAVAQNYEDEHNNIKDRAEKYFQATGGRR